MEASREPVRQSPLTVVCVLTSTTSFDALKTRWLKALDKYPPGSLFIAIADGVTFPNTAHARLRIVHHPQLLGLGAAVQTALWSLTTPLVLFIPADGSFEPSQLPALLERIDQADIVVGSRNIGPIPAILRIRDLLKSILARVFLGYVPPPRSSWPGWHGACRRWAARHFFGVPLDDPESGVLLARRSIFDRIPIQSRGAFAWIEILAKANHLGCLLDEVVIKGPERPAEYFASDALRVFRQPDFGPPRIGS